MSAVAKLYMKLTSKTQGLIEGESVTVHFDRQIEIDDWTWSVETPSGEAASDASTPSIFGFSKLMDRSTTNLLTAMRSGELLDAEISLQEMSRDTFDLKLFLFEIRVIDYAVNGRNNKANGEIGENWKFKYSRINFEFRPTARPVGGASGVITADVVSRPGTPDWSPAMPKDEMIKLARRITESEWPALLVALEKQRDSLQNAPVDAPRARG